MSTGVPRWVIVDDMDSRIQYSGPWFGDKGSQDSVGPSGPAYQSTLHGTLANASLEFAYHGECDYVLLKHIELLIDWYFRVQGPSIWDH
jgi:hypothetical protein